MSVFSHKEFDQHEQVSYFHDEATGLKAIIAVHNTALGPALGGCRMWAYDDDEQALRDVLRLARGMTYKAAVSNLPLGGGKSVIIGDARKIKTPELMKAMGRNVAAMGGRYIIAEDVGTNVEDMVNMATQSDCVVGLPSLSAGAPGEAGHGGDPSPVTAYGVYVGLKAAVKHRLGKNDLKGVHVAVQGLGNVGYNLCRLLHKDGAVLTVTDIQPDRIEQAISELGATASGLNEIYDTAADVFAPCALGAILNDDTIPRIKAHVIAGAANNQLAEARHGDILRDRKILYTPDYVLNAGGLINVYYEYLARKENQMTDPKEVRAHVDSIASTLDTIFAKADSEGLSTAKAADLTAEARFGVKKQCKAA